MGTGSWRRSALVGLFMLPLGLPGGVTAVVCVLLVRAPLLRCCLRCLGRASLAAQPGALQAEPSSGGALFEVLSRPGTHGGLFGMDGRVIFLATGLSAPHASPLGGLLKQS